MPTSPLAKLNVAVPTDVLPTRLGSNGTPVTAGPAVRTHGPVQPPGAGATPIAEPDAREQATADAEPADPLPR